MLTRVAVASALTFARSHQTPPRVCLSPGTSEQAGASTGATNGDGTYFARCALND